MGQKSHKPISQNNPIHASLDDVFQMNLVRHALNETMDKWRETNLPSDSRKTLLCVPEALRTHLGETRTLSYLAKLAEANAALIEKIQDTGTKQETWEQEQRQRKKATEAAEHIWDSLNHDTQKAILAQRKISATSASDTDIKIATYELVQEIYARTKAWKTSK
jgi:hypothetical protein